MNYLSIDGRGDVPSLRRPRSEGENDLVAGHPWIKGDVRHLFACVVPVLQKRDLKSHDGGAFDLKVGISPRSQKTQPEIFVARNQPSRKRNPSIDENQFPMIAKVDLKMAAKIPI